MHTLLNTTAIVRAADTGSGSGFNAADASKSNVAAKPARKPAARKLGGKSTAAAKPAAKRTTGKPAAAAEPNMHNIKLSRVHASAPIRGHGRKLSPIVLDRIPNTYTDRDGTLLKALHGTHKLAAFKRLDIDAGALSRLIGHGYVKHVSGMLDQRDATFAVTAKAASERFRAAAAPKA